VYLLGVSMMSAVDIAEELGTLKKTGQKQEGNGQGVEH